MGKGRREREREWRKEGEREQRKKRMRGGERGKERMGQGRSKRECVCEGRKGERGREGSPHFGGPN